MGPITRPGRSGFRVGLVGSFLVEDFWNHIDIHRILVRFRISSIRFRSFFYWVRIYLGRFLSCRVFQVKESFGTHL